MEYRIYIKYIEDSKPICNMVVFKSREERNDVYNNICNKFKDYKIHIDNIRDYPKIQVSTHNVNDSSGPYGLAHFIPTTFYKKEALEGIIKELESIN